MKNIVFILGISLLLFSCKKDKLEGGSALAGCPGMYEYSQSIDLSFYDTVSYTAEPLSVDTLYSRVEVNPNNPFEIFFLKNVTQGAGNYSLCSYNFCTNQFKVIRNEMIPYSFDVSSQGWILFVYGSHLYKIRCEGTDLIQLPYLPTIEGEYQTFLWSPNGNRFITYNGEIYDNQGIPVDTINLNNKKLLGWYNNNNILISGNGNVYKVDINSEVSSLFTSGIYNFYDTNSELLFKRVDSLNYQKWNIYNINGMLINETPFHNQTVLFTPQPKVLDMINQKLVMNLSTQEYYPNPNVVSSSIILRNRIVIMDMDGSNVRKIDFPE